MPQDRLEKMRLLAEEFRVYGDTGVGTGNGVAIRIVASADEGEGWEHVSVSTVSRCPAWDEMCFVKDLFWLPEEAAMQLHPPESEYVNNHPFCLHLWRPTQATIPMPPSIYVGVKSAGVLKSPEEATALRERTLKELAP